MIKTNWLFCSINKMSSQKIFNYSGFDIRVVSTTDRTIKQNTFEIFTTVDGGIGVGKSSAVYLGDKYQFEAINSSFKDLYIGYSTNGANSVWGENTLESGGFFIYKDGSSSAVKSTSSIIPFYYVVTDDSPTATSPSTTSPSSTSSSTTSPSSTSRDYYIWIIIIVIIAVIVVALLAYYKYKIMPKKN
jgi:hypothetical protein